MGYAEAATACVDAWVYDLVHGPQMRLQLPHATLAGAVV